MPCKSSQAEAELGLESQTLKRGKSTPDNAGRGGSERSGRGLLSWEPGAVPSWPGSEGASPGEFPPLCPAYCHVEVGMISQNM